MFFYDSKNCGHINNVTKNNFDGGTNMKKSLLFVSSSILSIGLLVGCNANGNDDGDNNGDTTGVNYNNRGVNTENVRYNYNDRLDPGNVRYDMNNVGNNGIFDNNRYNGNRGTFNNRGNNNGDGDLVDVDYDNAEPDPGEEPNEDRNPLMDGNDDDNDNNLFDNDNNRNRNFNGNGNGAGGGMRTGTTR